jgi:putative FmdB family regulatory protein
MPLYDYRCAICDYQFEHRQSFSDEPLRRCPRCKGKLEKLLTAPGIVFKGSGFYKNDSRSSGSSKETAAKSKPAPASEASTPSIKKPEVKPAGSGSKANAPKSKTAEK